MFLDTSFLKNKEIQLVLEKTENGDKERNWVLAYHFSINSLAGCNPQLVMDLRI